MRKCLTTSPSYNIPIKSQKCKNIQNDTPTKQVKFQTKFRIKDQGAYPNKESNMSVAKLWDELTVKSVLYCKVNIFWPQQNCSIFVSDLALRHQTD